MRRECNTQGERAHPEELYPPSGRRPLCVCVGDLCAMLCGVLVLYDSSPSAAELEPAFRPQCCCLTATSCCSAHCSTDSAQQLTQRWAVDTQAAGGGLGCDQLSFSLCPPTPRLAPCRPAPAAPYTRMQLSRLTLTRLSDLWPRTAPHTPVLRSPQPRPHPSLHLFALHAHDPSSTDNRRHRAAGRVHSPTWPPTTHTATRV